MACKGLRTEIHQSMGGLWTEMNSRFNILIVVMVGAWMTLMAALIALFLK